MNENIYFGSPFKPNQQNLIYNQMDNQLKAKSAPKFTHACVCFQQMMDVYCPMVGLERGTIFPELDMPYVAQHQCNNDG